MTEPQRNYEFGMFMRQPKLHEGRRVTSENLAELAAWCEGTIYGEDTKDPYIRVPNEASGKPRSQYEARVGHWIFKMGRNAYVYSDSYMRKNFIPFGDQKSEEPPAPPAPQPVVEVPQQQSNTCCCHHEHHDNVRTLPNASKPDRYNGRRYGHG